MHSRKRPPTTQNTFFVELLSAMQKNDENLPKNAKINEFRSLKTARLSYHRTRAARELRGRAAGAQHLRSLANV